MHNQFDELRQCFWRESRDLIASKIKELTNLENAKTEETQLSSPISITPATLFNTREGINVLNSCRPIEHPCDTSVQQEHKHSNGPDVSSPPSTFASIAFNHERKTVSPQETVDSRLIVTNITSEIAIAQGKECQEIYQNRVVHHSGIQFLSAYHLFDKMSMRDLEVFRPSRVTFASNLIGLDIASAEMCVRYDNLDVYLHNTLVNGILMHRGRDKYESPFNGVSGCVQFDPGGLNSVEFLVHLCGLEVLVEMSHRDVWSHKGVCGIPWDPRGTFALIASREENTILSSCCSYTAFVDLHCVCGVG